MENNPDMESFEDFIKQQSDDFRMYPAKRVWYSLYNNLHPGRKWPSISMCIVLLTTLFLVGFLNTNNNHSSLATANSQANNLETDISNKVQNIFIQNTNLTATRVSAELPAIEQKGNNSKTVTVSANPKTRRTGVLLAGLPQTKAAHSVRTKDNNLNDLISTGPVQEQVVLTLTTGISAKEAANSTTKPTDADLATDDKASLTESASLIEGNYGSDNGSSLDQLQKLPGTSIESQTAAAAETATASFSITDGSLSKSALAEIEQEASKNVVTNLTDKSWIENYALYNKPAPKKWKGKMLWQAYFTPSATYRRLYNNAAGKPIGNLNSGLTNSTDQTLSKEVTQSASIGLEAGAGLQYPVLKGVKIKAGLQFNYTRYNVSAFENSHPTITSLEMLSEIDGKPYELYKNTAYSNYGGLLPVTLHSQTFQLSLPVGADIKLASNDLFDWYAGAAIQPTLVFGGSSYLVSTDRRNYVKDNSMLNHFNMNAAFETYISFKSAGGLTWQVGPQLRKQLYTTSTKFFTVEEKLVGYGLKVGIIKKL